MQNTYDHYLVILNIYHAYQSNYCIILWPIG